LLALESELNPKLSNPDTVAPKSLLLADLNFDDASRGLPQSWPFRQAFAIDTKNGSRLTLVPFADARDYRVWLMKP
jgi:hypothetical protein